ncbi:MAG: serpin family protein [Thermostichales cyanobacterium SZTDM-1c_bins_54]
MIRWRFVPAMLAALTGAVISIAHATSFAASPQPQQAPTMPPNAPTADAFSFAFWQTVQTHSQETNRIVSPISAYLALAMLYNGAAGTTQQAMAQALHISGIPIETINRQAQGTLERLNAGTDAQIQLQLANSLWLNQGIPIRPAFVAASQRFYGAEVRTLPFDLAALEAINGWAREKTSGKIPGILDAIDSRGIAYLLNAVYFKGNWTRAFQPQLTQPQPFTLANGETISHPLMSQMGSFAYLETDLFQAVRLPYGESGAVTMTVVLPKGNLEEFYRQLNPGTWKTWQEQFQEKLGSLKLPRFQTEATFDLKPMLAQLGMEIAFTGAADFSALTPEPAAVSRVIQKTFLEVNETGTEAAAVTAIGVARLAAPIDTFTMVVDRPFFLVIGTAEEILFMGDVRDPRS